MSGGSGPRQWWPGDDGFPHFVIVGSPRSGTTLVQRLASELPGVQVTSETHFFPLFYDRDLRSLSFPLSRVSTHVALERYLALKPVRGLRMGPEAVLERLPESCPDAWTMFAAIVGVLASGASVVGEKTPDHLRWWRPLHEASKSMRFVWVLRDPRAVVASAAAAPFGMNSPLLLAANWRQDQLEMKRAQRVLGNQLLILRYEDVVRSPSKSQELLAGFLRVEGEPVPIGQRGVDLFLSWESDWKRKALGAPDEGRITAWRRELTPKQVGQVEAVTGATMLAAGYERSMPRRRSRLALLSTRPDQLAKLGRVIRARHRQAARAGSTMLRATL